MERYFSMETILTIDQGTSSTRAIVFNESAEIIAKAQEPISVDCPKPGYVMQDPEVIWQSVLTTVKTVLSDRNVSATAIRCCGMTNQRETTIIWDRKTGDTIYPAIVWQDRRTSAWCQEHKTVIWAANIQSTTGLLLDPYFSATKIAWILDNVPDARSRAEKGELAFGTIDSFLIWRLTGGTHVTDVTNASRTMLFDIHKKIWSSDLLQQFNIPASLLPEVLPSSAAFGTIDPQHFGHAIPITGVAGDQHASTVGNGCTKPGMVKSTYGTGCFVLANTGKQYRHSKHRLLTTIAYETQDTTHYGLEGSIFIAGAAVQWLRDTLKIINTAGETAQLAESIDDTNGVYFVPAFTGLGAPHWDPDARGAISGLNRDSNVAHIVRATLEAACYQTLDLFNAMQADGVIIEQLRVDGGMVVNNWLMQFLADMLQVPITRAKIVETTALGAALLAGIQVGIFQSLDEATSLIQSDRCFDPKMPIDRREQFYQGWQQAINCLRRR